MSLGIICPDIPGYLLLQVGHSRADFRSFGDHCEWSVIYADLSIAPVSDRLKRMTGIIPAS